MGNWRIGRCYLSPKYEEFENGFKVITFDGMIQFNPVKSNVSGTQVNVGSFWPPPGNEWRSAALRPYVAKSYFETYKSYDNMQKIKSISQKFTEILSLRGNKIILYLDLRKLPYQI